MHPVHRRILALLLLTGAAPAQQRADPDYQPRLSRPAYSGGGGPVVAIDQAHANFHDLTGGYAPFGRLLAADGYWVRASTGALTPATLAGVGVLVIANARSRVPGGSAFSAEEIAAVRAWVEDGGALLLVADHAPFGSATAALARAFGVDMGAGYVVAREGRRISAQIRFSGRQLGRHPMIAGRGGDETVRRVTSFTGQSLGVPTGATALLTLPDDALEVAGVAEIAALRAGRRFPPPGSVVARRRWRWRSVAAGWS